MVNLAYTRWLEKAKDDLNWAEASFQNKIYYGACFAAQQAVEKTIKAYLIYKGERLRKVHDLVLLIDEAKKFDSSFEKFRTGVAKLSQYYVETRYPDIVALDYTEQETAEAINFAKDIVQFVEDKIS